ncbi:MAG: hypothetical protein MUP85_00610 [Candidatus Lokiarchaeota archaeon]|nr:hypothetical protein [Candidatus Lokiarchaeota archaeon]
MQYGFHLTKTKYLKSVKYIFTIATRGGTKCFAFNKINQLLKRNCKYLDATFILTIISNDPKFEDYEIPTGESILKAELKIQTRLDSISRIIINKEKYQEKDSDYIDFPFSKPINYLLERLVLLGMFWADVTLV